MACFVCDEKLTDDVNRTSQSSDCSRCGPAVSLNWKNGQHVLEHMGAHVLHDSMLDSSEELCGLCLCPAPMCQLYLRKARGIASNFSVDHKKSSCVNLIHFNYATASTSSEASPCSNVPITCPLCPDGSSAVWAYSLHAHFCHDPSHGGSYMAEGAFYIRIGLPPRVVSGDCLASSRLWTDCLHCYRAHPMSRDWGCISMSFPYLSMRP